MYIDYSSVERAVEIASVQGVGRAVQACDPNPLRPEVVSPYARDPEWMGRDVRVLTGNALVSVSDEMKGVMRDLSKVAQAAGSPDWEANYLMYKTATSGIGGHYDADEFRDFSFFVGVDRRNDFFYRRANGRIHQMVMNPGDIWVLRQNPRVWHGVGDTGLRSVLNVSRTSWLTSAYNTRER